jgi:chitin disaccharide deacetylase
VAFGLAFNPHRNYKKPSMARANKDARRRLVVNADDFGRSSSINEAVVRGHRDGILTTASLMVNEPACDEAVALARENPRLGVGLHLALSEQPVTAGFQFFFNRGLRPEIRRQIQTQIDKFLATGLTLDHVNSHHHLHMHPTVVKILLNCLADRNINRVRLTWEPFWINVRHITGRRLRNLTHALIYCALARNARRGFQDSHIKYPKFVFGLMQNHAVDETYVMRLLPVLPGGDSELYSHPSMNGFRHEFDALVSPRVREIVSRHGIQLIRYQDL